MTKSREAFFSSRGKEGYYKEAKKINVRARSYFKLEQLDNKFDLIKEGEHIIDLGCAPGGWLEYIDGKLENAKIVGIDLLYIKKQHEFSKNVEIIEDDFANIEDYVEEEFDLVLSDMAPEFSGDSKVDRGKTHKLNIQTIEFCEKYLKKGGKLAFKTFGGEDLAEVRKRAKEVFWQVKEYKPFSSQKKSAELFITCFNKKN